MSAARDAEFYESVSTVVADVTDGSKLLVGGQEGTVCPPLIGLHTPSLCVLCGVQGLVCVVYQRTSSLL